MIGHVTADYVVGVGHVIPCVCHVTSCDLQVEAGKYAQGVQWVREVLYGVQFTKDRLLVVANKMINDVSRCV